MLLVNNMLKLETVTRKGYDNFHDADYNYYDSVVIGGQRGWMRCKHVTLIRSPSTARVLVSFNQDSNLCGTSSHDSPTEDTTNTTPKLSVKAESVITITSSR